MKNFGQTGAPSGTGLISNRILYQVVYYCPQPAIAKRLVAYMTATGSDRKAKGAIYYNSGTGFVPWAVTEELTISHLISSTYYFNFPHPPILRSDVGYRLAIWGDLSGSDQCNIYTTATGNSPNNQSITYAVSWPDPGVPGIAFVQTDICLYCEYLEANLLGSRKIHTRNADSDLNYLF